MLILKGLDWAILPEFVVNTKTEIVQVTLVVLLNLKDLWALSTVKWSLSPSFVNCKMDTFSVLHISKHWLVTFISFPGVKNNDMLTGSTSRPKNTIFCWEVRMDFLWLITNPRCCNKKITVSVAIRTSLIDLPSNNMSSR